MKNNKGIFALFGVETQCIASSLGVASTLRRVKSKAPALPRIFRKAGAFCMLTVAVASFSCGNRKQEANKAPNRVYFTIPAEDRKIMLPLQVGDTVTVNMAFDTGTPKYITLDSTIFALHPELLPEIIPDTVRDGVAWAEWKLPALYYHTPFALRLGDTVLDYSAVTSMNWKHYMNNPMIDGIFGIPLKDSTNVWELNFEHNYLEIHPADNFVMPENCYLLPFVHYDDNNRFLVQLPMKIQSADGDTLTMNRTFFIDAGMSWDIALMCRAEELAFFNTKDDAVWTVGMDSYYRHYNVNATLFDGFVIDSLRIYTFDYSNRVGSNYLLGTNFLKRFNVFFDMKNRCLGLLPIENFQRVVNPLARRFHLLTKQTPDGKIRIAKIADYKGNYYKMAGLQEGDEMLTVNGIDVKDANMKELQQKEDSLIYEVNRRGKLIRIVVHIDKNEVRGE
jgi:hypothetical protein